MRSVVSQNPVKSWRDDAVKIVEELFPHSPTEFWNLLLDLRMELVRGDNWDRALDVFLASRVALEKEQYLPFYRLRRLLAESLRFEAGSVEEHVASIKLILSRKHRSLADIKRAVCRELFEHDLSASAAHPIELRVVER